MAENIAKSKEESNLYRWNDIEFPYKAVIVDISGTIADGNLIFTKKIWICMQYANILGYGIGFQDMILAFGQNKINEIFNERNVQRTAIEKFWDTWQKIPEHSPGDIKIFHDVVPTLNTLATMDVQIAIASRLFATNFDLVIEELKRRKCQPAMKGKLIAESPRTVEERMRDDCMFHVLKRAIESTDPPRMYIDDTLDRFGIAKKLDPSILCVGSCRGLFGREQLRQAGPEEVVTSDFEEILKFRLKRR